jgi:hypothetical protein
VNPVTEIVCKPAFICIPINKAQYILRTLGTLKWTTVYDYTQLFNKIIKLLVTSGIKVTYSEEETSWMKRSIYNGTDGPKKVKKMHNIYMEFFGRKFKSKSTKLRQLW